MKTVICYLSRSDEKTVNDLKMSLAKLYENYKFIYDSDVIIFVENDFNQSEEQLISEKYSNLKFNRIILSPSIDLKIDVNTIPFEDKTPFNLGYRHMCQFFFSEVRNYIKEYDWYMRLDTDSFINSKIDYNIFKFLEDNNKVYGYVAEIPEWPPAVVDVDKFFLNIVKKYNLTPHFLDKIIEDGKFNLRHFYNNFEIAKLSYFEREDVKLLTKLVNESGNIYRWRWGDNVLRTFVCASTVDTDKIYKFEDFDYYHWHYKREGTNEICFYVDYQLELYNKWKNEGWWIGKNEKTNIVQPLLCQ